MFLASYVDPLLEIVIVWSNDRCQVRSPCFLQNSMSLSSPGHYVFECRLGLSATQAAVSISYFFYDVGVEWPRSGQVLDHPPSLPQKTWTPKGKKHLMQPLGGGMPIIPYACDGVGHGGAAFNGI